MAQAAHIPAGQTVVVRLDAAAVARLMGSPSGDGYKFLSVVAERVKVKYRAGVGVSKGPLHGTQLVRGKEKHLRDSIVKRPVKDSRGAAWLVGAVSPIAELHEKGTRPHVIVPRTAKALRFAVAGGSAIFSPLGGFLVFTKRVNHPGTRPNPALARALEEVRRI